jgi:4a-hydroxytetrahydrobiopterin dehydratase
MARLLEPADLDRQLADLPGVVRNAIGTLAVAMRAPTFADAVRAVDLVAHEAEEMDHHPDVDLRWRTVIFTLSTHSAGGITQLDVELASRILDVGREIGARILPRPARVEICLDAVDVEAVRTFWAAGLGYTPASTPSGDVELHSRDGRSPVLWFQRMDPPRTERGRFHLDVYLPDVEAARKRLQECLQAGGTLVTDVHAPSFWVVADPEGNELCVCTDEPGPSAE